MDKFNYKPDLEIKENDLDGEWIKQAGLFAHWVEKWANKLKEKDLVWLEKKTTKARLFKEAKIALTENGKLPSDTRCEVEVHAHPDYREVSERLIALEEDVNILDGVKWAFEQKKKSLDRLSDARDRERSMPDGHSSPTRRDDAIERKNQESEEIDKANRWRISRG